MAWYGRPNKPRRDTPAQAVNGRVMGVTITPVVVPVLSAEPFGLALMHTLGLMYPTSSPASNGNGGGITNNIGAGITGRDARRTGPLQDWTAIHGPIANPASRKVGMQGGPGAQPAFPSTGGTTPPGIYSSLAGMGLPQVLRTPGV